MSDKTYRRCNKCDYVWESHELMWACPFCHVRDYSPYDPCAEGQEAIERPPPVKKKRVQSPEQRAQNAKRKAIQEYFEGQTYLHPPEAHTGKARAGLGSSWWKPLRQILERCDWNVTLTKKLIDKTLEQMADLTVSDPRSILKTAMAIYAKRSVRCAPPPERETDNEPYYIPLEDVTVHPDGTRTPGRS